MEQEFTFLGFAAANAAVSVWVTEKIKSYFNVSGFVFKNAVAVVGAMVVPVAYKLGISIPGVDTVVPVDFNLGGWAGIVFLSFLASGKIYDFRKHLKED